MAAQRTATSQAIMEGANDRLRPQLRIQSGLFMKEAHGRPPQPVYEEGVQPPPRGGLQSADIRPVGCASTRASHPAPEDDLPEQHTVRPEPCKKGKGPVKQALPHQASSGRSRRSTSCISCRSHRGRDHCGRACSRPGPVPERRHPRARWNRQAAAGAPCAGTWALPGRAP